MNPSGRTQIKTMLRAYLEQTIEDRVTRFLEIDHHWIMGRHPFSVACFEAIELYRDGYFTACLLLIRSISDSLLRFVAERNLLNDLNLATLPQQLCSLGLLSPQTLQVLLEIQTNMPTDLYFRKGTPAFDFEQKAKQSLLNLSVFESEIFSCLMLHGKVIPRHPKYWDLEDGAVPLFFGQPNSRL